MLDGGAAMGIARDTEAGDELDPFARHLAETMLDVACHRHDLPHVLPSRPNCPGLRRNQ
jgi:hypothetical protein